MERKKGCVKMIYHIVNIVVYIISVVLSLIGLSCFDYSRYIRPGKLREFYIFYIISSLGLAYLFASFILSFATASFYS